MDRGSVQEELAQACSCSDGVKDGEPQSVPMPLAMHMPHKQSERTTCLPEQLQTHSDRRIREWGPEHGIKNDHSAVTLERNCFKSGANPMEKLPGLPNLGVSVFIVNTDLVNDKR